MVRFALSFFIFSSLVWASPLCKKWGTAKQIGELDLHFLNEASGMAVSRRFPNRIYMHNDSGDAGNFYITDGVGKGTRTVSVNGFDPKDVEDTALGPCGSKTCLFLADIGDNFSSRPEVEIVAIEEQENFPSSVDPLYRLKLKYPDGAHNAEAFVVLPNGDFYIFTKNSSPTKVYHGRPGSHTLDYMGALDLPTLKTVTAATLSADGKRLLLLTYKGAVEVLIDLTKPIENTHWKAGLNYNLISLVNLPQQEAIDFLNGDERSFLYTSEAGYWGLGALWTNPALMRVDCQDL